MITMVVITEEDGHPVSCRICPACREAGGHVSHNAHLSQMNLHVPVHNSPELRDARRCRLVVFRSNRGAVGARRRAFVRFLARPSALPARVRLLRWVSWLLLRRGPSGEPPADNGLHRGCPGGSALLAGA